MQPTTKTIFRQLLQSMQKTQNAIHRLLSLPGFSNLIECDSFLRRLFTYTTGLPSQMACLRTYQPTVTACEAWALTHCTYISIHERMFWQTHDQRRRSNWLCHAGLFGIFRKIY